MSIENQSRNLNAPGPASTSAPEALPAGIHPLQQAALRLGDARDGRSRVKAKELVGLLLSYGARAWRASQPVAYTRIRAQAPSGTTAVRMRFR
ncbi:hypothetical protein LQ948_06955 [Jiella sp. MQZ9-1]|uniref:Uncharacterized protein n=1 Tax=Jiella flava TaxID=2816857 RepID=A0A939JVQ5_9HYPH|nr:hypothetical protein [Jiella flava]MBO0662227.1 hypothetical protein [Jiella flava]MCD2470942.1 hypothetical protein [Jiella flava]